MEIISVFYDNDFILNSTKDKVVDAEYFHFMKLTLKFQYKTSHSDVS